MEFIFLIIILTNMAAKADHYKRYQALIVNQVYGISLDLGAFLDVYGTVFDGNPLSPNPGNSIGGPSNDTARTFSTALARKVTPPD